MSLTSKNIELAELANLLRTNELKLSDYVKETCDKLEEVNKKVFAFLPEEGRGDRLQIEASKLEEKYPDVDSRPILYGVLVGIKDIILTDNFETKGGSKLPAELFIGEEASLVTKLKNAGALILGKTETTEFAYFEPAPTRNPHNLNCTPGGSSSGSAAAVSAGVLNLTIGTQTIGSVTRPAAFCGIVGFKPSFGRIENDGVIPFSLSVDHVGFFVQQLSEINIPTSILCNDWDDNKSKLVEKPTIGIVTGKYLTQADAEMQNFFESQVNSLKKLGYKVVKISAMENIEHINLQHQNLNAFEFAQVHSEWYNSHKEYYRAGTIALIEKGQSVYLKAAEYARDEQVLFREEIKSVTAENNIDVWLSPATVGEAPEGFGTGSPIMNLPWTFLGLPTITFPAGKSKNKLPLGLQFAGHFMQDEQLLAFVQTIETDLNNLK